MSLPAPPTLLANPHCDRSRAYGPAETAILSLSAAETARSAITAWAGYAPTPLLDLAGLAAEAGLGSILYKDEDSRFDLKSFKALGGAYAVELLARRHGPRDLVVTCATDGNHGRAVAWGARSAGCRAVIYVHEGVSEDEFVAMRTARDATLDAPRLLLPSIQVNIRAGKFPPAEANGVRYLTLPVKVKGGADAL